MKQQPGAKGGTIYPREKGDPALPGAGRRKNPFKEIIQDVAEGGTLKMTVEGFLLVDGVVTNQKVLVQITLPAADAVVRKMFKKAAKGNVPAAKWLTETGYDKTLKIGEDPDNPLGGGFAVILPDNKR